MYESRIPVLLDPVDTSRFGAPRLSIDSTRYTPHLTLGTSFRLFTHKICKLFT